MSSNEDAIKRKYAANASGDDAYESYGKAPAAPAAPPPPPPSYAAPTQPAVAVAAVAVAPPSPVQRMEISNAPAMAGQEIVIPDRFCKLLCMACTCCNCNMPYCFGCAASSTCLCQDGYCASCKAVDDPKICCVCNAQESICVYPSTCCKRYDQCFCFECLIAFPSPEAAYKTTPSAMVTMATTADGTQSSGDVAICCGSCCQITSCYCDFPDCCCSYQSKGVCCCQEHDFVCMKMMCWDEQKKNKDLLCICFKGNSLCVYPYTCCKGVDRCCYCDCRRACPCDDDVPCVYSGICFCTCCTNFACNVTCCATINDVIGQRNPPLVPKVQYNNSTAPVTAQPM